ncbi:MAG: hypothetical protein OEW56_14180, partial [Gemmatimonadota bacterium]|nr:hypothetical protein [Gemmatimonadota bacterium]
HGAVDGGRLNDQGVLMRFHPDIDDEYAVDAISVFPGLGDEYAWQAATNGARYWGGSINHRALAAGFDVKAGIGLGRGWRVGFRFDKEDRPGLARSLPRFGVEKFWEPGVFAFAGGTLVTDKPEMDMTVGAGWRDRAGEARVSLTVLDAFSQAIYQGLDVVRTFAPTALDYEKAPYALRITTQRQVGRHLRVEADLGTALPSTLRAYDQLVTDSGFRQDEEFGMAAALLEWTTLPTVRVGAMATRVRAITDRTPLTLSRPEDDFRLVERTSQVGGYILFQPTARWRAESWLLREHRPQTKEFRNGAQPDVDYEDRAWRGQTLVRYLAGIGFKAEAALEMDLRDVIRGDGQVPSVEGSVGRRNTRLRLELGWRFGNRFWVEGGYRIDLDGDVGTGHGSFDGAHGRATLFW